MKPLHQQQSQKGFTPTPKYFGVSLQSKRGFTPTPKYFGVSLQSKRGFTLVELLVAVVLFSFIVSLAMGIFFNALRNQRITLALMAANDNAQSALEQMAREMRTSSSFTLLPPGASASSIQIVNALGKTVIYRLNSAERVEREEAGGAPLAITGSNVKVERLLFTVTGGTAPLLLSRVTVTLKVAPSLPGASTLPTNMQITISPR